MRKPRRRLRLRRRTTCRRALPRRLCVLARPSPTSTCLIGRGALEKASTMPCPSSIPRCASRIRTTRRRPIPSGRGRLEKASRRPRRLADHVGPATRRAVPRRRSASTATHPLPRRSSPGRIRRRSCLRARRRPCRAGPRLSCTSRRPSRRVMPRKMPCRDLCTIASRQPELASIPTVHLRHAASLHDHARRGRSASASCAAAPAAVPRPRRS